MTNESSLPSLRWRSYWRRAPLMLQARLGDREAEGLSEVLALLRGRPAAAFACSSQDGAASLLVVLRERGFGTLRLRAQERSAEGRSIWLVLGVGPPAGSPEALEAAARRLAGDAGAGMCVVMPGDDAVARLQALASLGLGHGAVDR